jgi:hypothetical protein
MYFALGHTGSDGGEIHCQRHCAMWSEKRAPVYSELVGCTHTCGYGLAALKSHSRSNVRQAVGPLERVGSLAERPGSGERWAILRCLRPSRAFTQWFIEGNFAPSRHLANSQDFFFLFSTTVRTQVLAPARQSLYHLSHTPSPFCFSFFS